MSLSMTSKSNSVFASIVRKRKGNVSKRKSENKFKRYAGAQQKKDVQKMRKFAS